MAEATRLNLISAIERTRYPINPKPVVSLIPITKSLKLLSQSQSHTCRITTTASSSSSKTRKHNVSVAPLVLSNTEDDHIQDLSLEGDLVEVEDEPHNQVAHQERLRRNHHHHHHHQLSIVVSTCCIWGVTDLLGIIEPSSSKAAAAAVSGNPLVVFDDELIQRLVLADLDQATTKLGISIIGPFLSAFSFLFILRIVMSWYPRIPVGKFPYVIVYAPTEPFLVQTRKLIPPLAGVDITPVVWVGLLNFLNEILVGPQGLLVLLSQQTN